MNGFISRTTTLAAALLALSATAQADNYQQPTRGLYLERGTVNTVKGASIDLATGSDDFENSGGIRLGLPLGELILNSNLSGGGANEAAFKIALPKATLGDGLNLDWASYLGLAHIDVDGRDDEKGANYTNIVLGAAATISRGDLLLTFNPEWEHADDARDDEILNLGFGVGYTFGETGAGRFQPNFEYTAVIGGKDGPNGEKTDGDDMAAGVRWMYNDRLTMDFAVLVKVSGTDANSLPGFMAVNYKL